MKTHTYCSELDEWISDWLINWLWSCHVSIRGTASCMILQIYHKIWRYLVYFVRRCAWFWWDKIHVAEELVNLKICVERIRNISSEEDSNVVNSTEVVVRESDSICIFQKSSNTFCSHSSTHCDMDDFSSPSVLYFVYLDLCAFIGKHKCVIVTDDFSIIGSHN